jgi:light-regulated signal transduction histidine kinase (bacteriophytochrome)
MSNDAIVKSLDGEQRNVTVYFSVCPGYEKSLSKTLVSLVDITKRKKAQQKIQELNKELELRVLERTSQLEIANKELEAFSYSVSHDLHAPLRGVIGFSEILNNEYKDSLNARGQKYLDLVQESAHRMSQLIDDMLKLSRVTQSDIIIGKVDLSQIVVKILEGLQNLEPNRKVKFQIQEAVIVNADRHLMQIVLQNLLDNAWKYSSKKSLSIIEFGTIEKDGINVCFLKDNGVGFNMNYKNKLFKTFQRLHTANEFSGTGIGLATVKRILDKHRGNVWVEAEEGIGATIYFSLP